MNLVYMKILLAFINWEEQIQSVLHKLIKSMNEFHLDVHRMCGQCYDRASTMSGIKSGVAKLLTDMELYVIYFHIMAMH